MTVLRTHPLLWLAYPDGDLSAMPDRVLLELYKHAQAERDDAARVIARETATAMLKAGIRPGS